MSFALTDKAHLEALPRPESTATALPEPLAPTIAIISTAYSKCKILEEGTITVGLSLNFRPINNS